MSKHSIDDSLRCSFCHKNQNAVGKLISSPSNYPRAHICDECIGVCAMILADDRAEVAPAGSPHPLLSHPLASDLMAAIEIWIREEALGSDVLPALLNVREIASRMVMETP
jgi:ATP-dependent protease Clp ATPase subunit